MEDDILWALAVFCGCFSIFCAAMNYDWFMNHPKAVFLVKRLGRDGARVFYVLLGLILLGVACWVS